MNRSVYFITHPKVIISKDVPVRRWPLSELGCSRMRQGLKRPWVKDITSIYCSNEQKSIDSARILAEYLSLEPTQVDDLGENDGSATGFLPADEFECIADEFFANPEASVRGWERAMDAQSRVVRAVEQAIGADRTSGAIAIVSHGAVGTLLHCELSRKTIARRWDQPSNGGGNYFRFTLEPRVAHTWWRPIDE